MSRELDRATPEPEETVTLGDLVGLLTEDPFAYGLIPGGFRQLGAYAETREQEDADLNRRRQDPTVLAMVTKRVKKSIGRTADIPIMCGSTKTGGYLAFEIVDGHAELVIVFDKPESTDGSRGRKQARLTGNQTKNMALQFTCLCDAPAPTGAGRMELAAKRQGARRTRLWLYDAALAAIAADTRKRTSVQLHT